MAAAQPSAPVAGALDRAPVVREMFEQLAPRYDLANRLLSLGLDQGWRKKAIRALEDSARGEMIDLCAGTLDLTVMLLAAGARHVHAMDFSESMLAVGATKIPAGAPVTITPADARSLPLADASVDGIICGFGLRNVPGVEGAVTECARVLRPGGHLVVLDFFKPVGLFPKLLQGSYNTLVLPVVGGLVTGYAEAYRYLSRSIEAWHTRAEFVALLEAHGFSAQGEEMFPPVASLITGTKRAEGAR